MTITDSSIIQRNPDIIFSEIENETVMMDKNFENYYGLSAIGTNIWNILENKKTLKSLCEELVTIYDIDYQQCQKDVTKLLEDLHKNEMLIIE